MRTRLCWTTVAWFISLLPFAISTDSSFSRNPHYTKPPTTSTSKSPLSASPAGQNPSPILDDRYSGEYEDPVYPYPPEESYEPDMMYPPDTSFQDRSMGETSQERVDQWRQNLQSNAEKYQNSMRDEKGRVKLNTSIGKGTRAVTFFMFIWRDVFLFELASNISSAASRMLITVPMLAMVLLNMAGFVASFSGSGKKRLKAILNLDKFVEIIMMVYALLRLSLFPSRMTAREVYIGSLIHSVVFIVQAQACTRFSWDEKSAVPLSSYHDAYRRSAEEHRKQHVNYNRNQYY